jgi:hypothetical protein
MLPRCTSPWFHIRSPLGDTILGARPRSARLRLNYVYPLFPPVVARARIRRGYPRVGLTTLKQHFEAVFLRPNKLLRLAGSISN